MFMITSTFVMSNAFSIKRKEFYIKLKTDTAQIGYDLQTLGLDDFLVKYTSATGGFRIIQDNATDYLLLTNKQKFFFEYLNHYS